MHRFIFAILSLLMLGVTGGCTQNTLRTEAAEPAKRPAAAQPHEERAAKDQKKAGARKNPPDAPSKAAEPGSAERPPAAAAGLTQDEIEGLIPVRVPDRAAWVQDIGNVFSALNLPRSAPAVCSVLAVIQQESGFQANPPVKGMAQIIKRGIERKFGNSYGKQAVRYMLDVKLPGNKATCWDRLMAAKTEADVDHVFADYVAYNKSEHAGLFRLAQFTMGVDDFETLNPITTIGSMQVSVRFALEHPGPKAMDARQTRDFLYTRYGGLYYGTLRLLGYPVGYDNPIYRFADYNAGMYSSRNAALQQQLAKLLGSELALDGDLLRYRKDGTPDAETSLTEKAIQTFAERNAPGLDRKAMRDQLLLEKSAGFESTKIYRAIRQAYAARHGSAPYAILPAMAITSPKISGKFSSAQFAQAVNAKYLKCLRAYEKAAQNKP